MDAAGLTQALMPCAVGATRLAGSHARDVKRHQFPTRSHSMYVNNHLSFNQKPLILL